MLSNANIHIADVLGSNLLPRSPDTTSVLPASDGLSGSPTLVDGHNVSHFKACDLPLLSRDAPYWSHSPYCPNWGYVKDFTQQLTANRNVWTTLAGMVFMPIGAGIADKQGRKPIFVFSFIMGMKALLANLVSSTVFFIHYDPKAYLLYASGLLSGMASSQGAVQMAMMVDIIPGDMREQGFPILALFNIPSTLGVLVLGYFLLAMHLNSYVIFWIISFSTDTLCLIGLLLLLPESMPDQVSKYDECCIEDEKFCTQNEELNIKNDDGFAATEASDVCFYRNVIHQCIYSECLYIICLMHK